MPPQRHWTQEELDLMRREYQHTRQSRRNLARRLGSSESAIGRQLAIMGVTKSSQRSWTHQEDQQLLDLVERRPLTTIASTMNRSMASVAARAKHLNACRTHRDRWYTLQETAAITGMDERTLITRIMDGALWATRHNYPQDQDHQQPYGCWHIEEKDLRRFIRQQPQDLSGRNIDIVQLVQVLAGLAPLHQGQPSHQGTPNQAHTLTPVDMKTTDGLTAFGIDSPTPDQPAALGVLNQIPGHTGIWMRTATINVDELAELLQNRSQDPQKTARAA